MKINFSRLFVSSESRDVCFYQEFSNGANIISGRNTSGKSSLIQSLIYTFGVNDVSETLSEILEYNPTFRLDFNITNNDEIQRYTIVREPNSIYVQDPKGKVIPFHGIDSDQRKEHVKLKEFIRKLFGFSLLLENKGSLSTASLECMFLPYYISQSVGWVYLRESFSNLNFYKGFKDDYLDYYLGVSNDFDRVRHRELKNKYESLTADLKNLNRYSSRPDFQFAQMVDEQFGELAKEYIDGFITKQSELEGERTRYVLLSNELSLYRNRHKVIKRTKLNLNKQRHNGVDRCPTCEQTLPHSLEKLYNNFQKYNDTVLLESSIQEKLKSWQSKINSSSSKIHKISSDISKNYEVILNTKSEDINFDQWISNKANLSLFKNIKEDIVEIESELESLSEDLRFMITEDDTINERRNKEKIFKRIFSDFTTQLGLKPLKESKYTGLYSINSFPRQGVELHKTVMAYHFALNHTIESVGVAHRFPFLLDAILKEDIDESNLDIILKFVGKNLPKDTQTFVSISEHLIDSNREDARPIDRLILSDVKNRYFPDSTKLFYIGEGRIERGFFSKPLDEYREIFNETIKLTMIN